MLDTVRKPVHPAAEIFPLMTGEPFEELKKSIKEHGLHEPIILYKGQVLDGRNRLAACIDLNIKPKFEECRGSEPVEYIWSHNGVRRHLTTSQRAMVAVAFVPLLKKEAKQRMLSGKRADPSPDLGEGRKGSASKATAHAAKMVGVGRSTVEQASRIKKDAPELAEEVRKGKVSINAAYKTLPPKPRAKGAYTKTAKAERAAELKKKIVVKALDDMMYQLKSAAAIARHVELKSLVATKEQLTRWIKSFKQSIQEITRCRKQLERITS